MSFVCCVFVVYVVLWFVSTQSWFIAGTAVIRLTRTIAVRDREDSENAAAAAVAALWASSRTGGTHPHPRAYCRAGHRRCAAWGRRTADRRGPGVVRPEPSPANGEASSSSSVPEEDDTVQSSLTYSSESRSWVVGHE